MAAGDAGVKYALTDARLEREALYANSGTQGQEFLSGTEFQKLPAHHWSTAVSCLRSGSG